MKEITKKAIMDSFVKLCASNRIHQITVESIVHDCGISKQTFYNHFKDKFDLMNYVYKVEMDYANSHFIKKDGDIEKAIEYMLERCLEYEKYYATIAKYEKQNSFAQFFFQNTKEIYTSYVTEKHGTVLAEAIKYEIEFTSAGAMQLFLGWIKSGMNEDPSKMASEMFNCIPLTLKKLI